MSRPVRAGRVLAAAGAALAALVTLAGPASAHVTVTPATAAPGAFGTFVFTVPDEEDGASTDGLDVALPRGLELESAEQVPGWTTTVQKAPDGTPVAVHWAGGRIAPGTFGTFSILAKLPTGRTARFVVTQHDGGTAVVWGGDPGHPAPQVSLGSVGAAASPAPSGAPSLSTVPPARNATGTADPAGQRDPVARSRAALGLALGVAALLLAVGGLVPGVVRRRGETAGPVPGPRAADRPRRGTRVP